MSCAMTWAMYLVLEVLSMSFPSCLALVIHPVKVDAPGQELFEKLRHEHHGCEISSRLPNPMVVGLWVEQRSKGK